MFFLTTLNYSHYIIDYHECQKIIKKAILCRIAHKHYIIKRGHALKTEYRILQIPLLPPPAPPRWVSPRPISTRPLHALLRFHSAPTYPVLYGGPYRFRVGGLVLGGASRLDAFSVYPSRAWLPCRGPSGPAGTPAARPPRSSRTKDSSSQISCARAG